jgi:hypothetical protein
VLIDAKMTLLCSRPGSKLLWVSRTPSTPLLNLPAAFKLARGAPLLHEIPFGLADLLPRDKR